jgi:DNA-binding transcriptional LysR family regulator
MRGLGSADLTIFLAIARHRNFRRAAVELGLTPSALSHALRSFEERIAVRLFNRTTRSVSMTEAGERLFARVGPAFRDIEDALDDLNTVRGAPMGTLRLNAPGTAAHMVLLPLVSRFLRMHPAVHVEIFAQSALVDVVSAGFDAGVRFGETIAADMIATPIGSRQRSAVVASPAYFEHWPKPITPRDLSRLPCVCYRFDSGGAYHWEFERGGVELEIAVEGPITLNHQDLMVEAALKGIGAAYVFEGMVESLVAEGRLTRVLQDWCPSYAGFFLYYPSRRRMPTALRAFIDFCVKERIAGGSEAPV